MKKLFLTGILLAYSVIATAESVETTKSFRNMMKRDYNITVPKTLIANSKSAEMCYGMDTPVCNKLGDICEKSRSQGCRSYNKKLQAIAAEEYDQ